jgi:hypothetical protein
MMCVSTTKHSNLTKSLCWHIETSTWHNWLIPMSTFNSLKLNSIKSVSIGVGYPDGSQVGSEGILFIDDLRIGIPDPVTE